MINLKEDLFKHFLNLGFEEEETLLCIDNALHIAKEDNYPKFYIDMLEDIYDNWEDWAYQQWEWNPDGSRKCIVKD